jgi:probable HAF family extracellular repeat protein
MQLPRSHRRFLGVVRSASNALPKLAAALIVLTSSILIACSSGREPLEPAAETPGSQPDLRRAATPILRDLGGLGGTWSQALGINEREDVVGFFSEENSPSLGHAVLWRNGQVTDLGTLPGGPHSEATGINRRGDIVGWSDLTVAGHPTIHAVIWRDGAAMDLGSLDEVSIARAINDKGEIVGESIIPGGSVHAVLWQNGQILDLGSFGGECPDGARIGGSTAWAINKFGQVVGQASVLDRTRAPVAEHAFLWQDGRMTDLGTLGGDFFSWAFGINDRGQVVGLQSHCSGDLSRVSVARRRHDGLGRGRLQQG